MLTRSRSRVRGRSRALAGPIVTAVVLTLVAVSALAVSAGAGTTMVEPPPGAGKPTAGSGIGTAAALNNPRCVHDEARARYGDYGAFDSTSVGGGPICVRPWKDGDDNGGSTYQGVTADKVKVVVLLPNEEQKANPANSAPINQADNSKGTYEDAVHDVLLSYLPWYETWGRDIEIKFLTSSGGDEAAQRADAVAAKAEKPFAAMHMIVEGLDVFEAEMANAKVLSWGYGTTFSKAVKQAPYRWGQSDAQAGAINSAEVIGKQLVGKKAEYAGDESLQGQTRKFGVVYMPNLIDVDDLKKNLAKYKGTIAVASPYEGNGATFGDPAVSQEQAPLFVTKMKQAGVTTVILFSDVSMTTHLMEEAIKQEWYPEWWFTGAVYHDIGALARGYPKEQSVNAFGISFLSPYLARDELYFQLLANNWYWGRGVSTTGASVTSQLVWLLQGIHTAGPKLTPTTFQQGLFSLPATGGAATENPASSMTAYGRNAGLPYDEYMTQGLDYAPWWWDPEQYGPSSGNLGEGLGVGWYLDGAKRYKASTWPKRQFDWFSKEGAIFQFDTRPVRVEYVGDCAACPAGGGPGTPGAPSLDGFVAVHGQPGTAT